MIDDVNSDGMDAVVIESSMVEEDEDEKFAATVYNETASTGVTVTALW